MPVFDRHHLHEDLLEALATNPTAREVRAGALKFAAFRRFLTFLGRIWRPRRRNKLGNTGEIKCARLARELDRAFACNLQFDHRVSAERAAVFDEFLKAAMDDNPDSSAFGDAVEHYLAERIRKPNKPDFVEPALNENNFLPLDGAPLRMCRWATRCRVLNLTGLGNVYSRESDPRSGILTRIGGLTDPTSLNRQLDAWFGGGWPYGEEPPRDIADFCKDLCNLRNRQPYPYHPAWTTYWRNLKTIVQKYPADAEHWLSRLGLTGDAGDWVALLKYSVRESGNLVRPTQLDAGRYALHFPSPRTKPVLLGGCIMPLDDEADGLCSEFIHLQCDWQPKHFVAIVKLKEGVQYDLTTRRQAHRRLLEKEYPGGDDWMPM